MDGQLSIFEFLDTPQKMQQKNKILSVGSMIGRVVLGECRVETVEKIDGSPSRPFYRTKNGCYSYEEGLEDVEELKRIAEKARNQYKTIVPKKLSRRLTIEYAPRECDGRVLWAQIGILDNMLFWKEDVTYQFLEPYDSKEKLMKEYEEHKKNILDNFNGHRRYQFIDREYPMRRLYWSEHGFYADAEYVKFNGK